VTISKQVPVDRLQELSTFPWVLHRDSVEFLELAVNERRPTDRGNALLPC